MIDLEQMFEEIDKGASRIKGLRYAIYVFLLSSLLLLGITILENIGIFELSYRGYFLYPSIPAFLSILAYLIGRKSKPDLHKFTYRLDEKLNTKGKLSSLYQIKEDEDKNTISQLLARRFIWDAPQWKEALQLPITTYSIGGLAILVFSVSIFILILPAQQFGLSSGEGSVKNRGESTIFFENETEVENTQDITKGDSLSRTKETGKSGQSSNSDKGNYASQDQGSDKTAEESKLTDEKMPELSKMKSLPSKNITTADRISKKNLSKGPSRSSENEESETMRTLLRTRDPEIRKKLLDQSIEKEESSSKRGKDNQSNNLMDSNAKGEKGEGKRGETGGKGNGKLGDGELESGSQNDEFRKNPLERGGDGGRGDSSGKSPGMNNREEGRQEWKAGEAKRGSTSNKETENPGANPEFTNKNVAGEIENVSNFTDRKSVV